MKVLVCFSPDTSRTVVSRYLYFIGKNNTMLHPKCSFNEKSCNVAKSAHLHTRFNHIYYYLVRTVWVSINQRYFVCAENNTNRECNGTHVSWHYIAQIFRYK